MAYVEEPPLSPEDSAMGEWPARSSGPPSVLRLAAVACALLCVGMGGCGKDDPGVRGFWHGRGTIRVNEGPVAELYPRCGPALPAGAASEYFLFLLDSHEQDDATTLQFGATLFAGWDAASSSYPAVVSGDSFEATGTFTSLCGKGTGTHRISGRSRGDTLDATLEIVLAGQQAVIELSLTRIEPRWGPF